MTLKAVILIGGPQKGKVSQVNSISPTSPPVTSLFYAFTFVFAGTRFRPLSLDIPKPLFPVAGLPIIQHHIEACVRIPELKEILILGYYPSSDLNKFVQEMIQEYKIAIRLASLQRTIERLKFDRVKPCSHLICQISTRVYSVGHGRWHVPFSRSNSIR
jgi:NDP-sugar pyrophosphorylase family protein